MNVYRHRSEFRSSIFSDRILMSDMCNNQPIDFEFKNKKKKIYNEKRETSLLAVRTNFCEFFSCSIDIMKTNKFCFCQN